MTSPRAFPGILVLCGLLAGAPAGAKGPAPLPLPELDAREELQYSLESAFNALCAALTEGRRQLPEGLAAPGVGPDARGFASLSGCSLRALRFEPTAGGRAADARVLWDLEGLNGRGERRWARGEADARLARAGAGWKLTAFAEAFRDEGTRPAARFVEVAAQAGLVLPPPEPDGAVPQRQRYAKLYGGGLSARDVDGDGRVDLIAVERQQAWLFRNRGGFSFEREPLGPPAPKGTFFTSAAVADFDNDGAPDVVLTVYSPEGNKASSLVLRNEAGHFSLAGRLPSGGLSQSAVPVDLDGDGLLDLVELSNPMLAGGPANPLEADDGEPPRFYLGRGDLTFRELPLPPALARHRWGLAAVSVDLIGAGRPQVYVANDFGTNDLWMLSPEGTLVERAAEFGLTDPGNGMSADVGDVNADGKLDLYVANMFSKAGTRVLQAARVPGEKGALLDKFARGNTLYVATAGGGFTERARELGVGRGLWAFGSLFLDFDNDARLDIAVANGFLSQPNRKDL